jgi:hypothetical protein
LLLAFLNCQGCQEQVASFKNHFRYTTDWSLLVGLFYESALSEVLEVEEDSKDEIYKDLCNYGFLLDGSSEDIQTQNLDGF